MQYFLNYSGTRFCPLKIKITQFPSGFRLKKLTTGSLVLFCPAASPVFATVVFISITIVISNKFNNNSPSSVFIWLPLNYGTIFPLLLEIYLQLMLSRRLLKLIYFRRRFPANLLFLFSLLRRICI